MKLTKKPEAGIRQVMDSFRDTYVRGDLDTCAAFLDQYYRNIGTTAEELWNSKKEILNYSGVRP